MKARDKETPSVADLKAAVEAERQARANQAETEIQAVLAKHRVTLNPVVELRLNQIVPRIEVVALE